MDLLDNVSGGVKLYAAIALLLSLGLFAYNCSSGGDDHSPSTMQRGVQQ